MHRGRPVGEPLNHRPPGWIRQSRKCCIQFIHNRMVVDCRSMSSANFAILDYCPLISLSLTLALNHIHISVRIRDAIKLRNRDASIQLIRSPFSVPNQIQHMFIRSSDEVQH
jgi:hypothetical protein